MGPRYSARIMMPPTLLLVEDDVDDQRFFSWAVKKAALPIVVRLAGDGDQAIEYLSRSPDRLFLILSDVHLPRRSGWDVLTWVRRQPALMRLPVLIWTSLPNPEGAERAVQLGATSYFSKPLDTGGYRNIVATVRNYLRD
jgi:CheY-like chemotaxis protein